MAFNYNGNRVPFSLDAAASIIFGRNPECGHPFVPKHDMRAGTITDDTLAMRRPGKDYTKFGITRKIEFE